LVQRTFNQQTVDAAAAQNPTPPSATPTMGVTQCSRASEIANFTVSAVLGAINFDANALVLDDSMNGVRVSCNGK